MCGFVGFIHDSRVYSNVEMGNIIKNMNNELRHRGPDAGDTWIDTGSHIALGHRRLSIIDLSVEANQPMSSHSGRFVMVYNGEVYNYIKLKQELSKYGIHYRSNSDTEVMLTAFEHWGVEKSIERFIGMFSFALWDCKDKILYLVRDRLGIKPLYYGYNNGVFLFASELKAFFKHPSFHGVIDSGSLILYLRHGYIPAPYTIFEGINKLTPGSIVKLSFGERLDEANSTLPVKYWSVEDVIAKGKIAPFKGTLEEATDVLEQLLKDAVALRMISDVPLGAFLSGGIDSSLVVALMQSLSSQPVKTFTIGFSEESYNEAIDAKKVAHYLGTEHTELYVTYNDAMSVIPNLSEVYDEPFADSSQIPTFLVSKLARSHVTVSLSGDGGDELFGGYTRYFSNYNPMTQNQLISSICKLIVGIDSHYCSLTAPFNHMRGYNRAKKTLFSGAQETYLYEVSTFTEPEKIIQSDAKHPTNFSCVNDLGFEYKELMMYLDTITYLPDDILVKLDRASMAVGLEGRVPILDHRVVEFAWQLPISYKISPGYSKILLKQLLYRYAPEELFNRPKQGFGIPVGLWLQGPLKEWASELLSETVVKKTSYFDPKAVQSLWKLHLSGKKDMQAIIWSILMFQMWRNKYK